MPVAAVALNPSYPVCFAVQARAPTEGERTVCRSKVRMTRLTSTDARTDIHPGQMRNAGSTAPRSGRTLPLAAVALALLAPAQALAAPVFGDIQAKATSRLFASGDDGQGVWVESRYVQPGSSSVASYALLETPDRGGPAAKMSARWEISSGERGLDYFFSAGAVSRTTVRAVYAGDFAGTASVVLTLGHPSNLRLEGSWNAFGSAPGDRMSTRVRLTGSDGTLVLDRVLGALGQGEAFRPGGTPFLVQAMLPAGSYTLGAIAEFHEGFGPTPQPNFAFAAFRVRLEDASPVPAAGGWITFLAGVLCVCPVRRRRA